MPLSCWSPWRWYRCWGLVEGHCLNGLNTMVSKFVSSKTQKCSTRLQLNDHQYDMFTSGYPNCFGCTWLPQPKFAIKCSSLTGEANGEDILGLCGRLIGDGLMPLITGEQVYNIINCIMNSKQKAANSNSTPGGIYIYIIYIYYIYII